MAASIALLGACAAGNTELRHYQDEGTVCVAYTNDLPPLGATPLVLRVIFDECASFCAEVQEAACTATVEDGLVTVSGFATTAVVDPDNDCPAACQVVDASCRTERLDPGSYRLRYGADERPIEVPGSAPGSCPASM